MVLVVVLLLLLVVGALFFVNLSSSAWLYRIKASRSRTLLSAFTQAAEKRAVSRVFLVWFGFAVLRVATRFLSTIRRGAAVFFSYFLIVFLMLS